MAALDELVESVLARLHIDLEDIAQTKAGSRMVVRITIDGDGPEGRGLTLDDVAEASREISRALDDAGIMGERPYHLEVGTRGVDKPLTKPVQYKRNTGRLVKLALTGGEPVVGRIESVTDEAVTLSGGAVVPFADISRGIVQIEMKRDENEDEE